MLTLKATGAFQGSVLEPMVGVTIIHQRQFDVNLNQVGPFTLATITTITMIPGHYWSTCSGSLWDSYVATGSVPDSCMQRSEERRVGKVGYEQVIEYES